MRQEKILIAGCGQVGGVLLEHFPNHYFNATFRPDEHSQAKRTRLHARGARAIGVDLNKPADLRRVSALSRRIIWMAAPDASQARDTTLLRLGLQCRANPWRKNAAAHITYVSTTGVYGSSSGAWVDELSLPQPQSARGIRRHVVEKQLRAGLAKRLKVHILRAPGIYGNQRLPTDRLKAGTPAIIAQEDSFSNHIHELDLARLCMRANFKGGAFLLLNACDGQPGKMGDYFDMVATHLGLPKPPRLPRSLIKTQVSPMMWSFMAESRQIKSIRLGRLGAFKLSYPSVAEFLQEHFPLQA